jgi:hypothetical protein
MNEIEIADSRQIALVCDQPEIIRGLQQETAIITGQALISNANIYPTLGNLIESTGLEIIPNRYRLLVVDQLGMRMDRTEFFYNLNKIQYLPGVEISLMLRSVADFGMRFRDFIAIFPRIYQSKLSATRDVVLALRANGLI